MVYVGYAFLGLVLAGIWLVWAGYRSLCANYYSTNSDCQ